MKRTAGPIATLAVVYTALPGAAHAYIDPGTGSILLQGIVGSAATAMVILKMYGAKARSKIAAMFGRADGSEKSASD